MPQKGPSIYQKPEKWKDQAAQCDEISPAAQDESQSLINADLAVSPQDGKEKQGGGGRQPETQVQQQSHQPSAQPLPDRPQQVVQQAQPHAHRQSLQQRDPLGGDLYPHGQRSSRDSSEPPRSRRSSS